jgi:hypothetical protein
MRGRFSRALNFNVRGAVLGIAVLSMMIVACGVKAPPVPPKQPDLPIIQNLKATLNGQVVLLQWAQPEATDPTAAYLIYRSVSDPDAEPCPGCPLVFEKAGRIDRSDASKSFTFSDPVAAGRAYRYKVVPVYSSGAAGRDSNLADVAVPVNE